MDAKGNMRRKLGRWSVATHEIERNFDYYLVVEDYTLWIRTDHGFNVHRCIWNRNIIRRYSKLYTMQSPILPPTAIPIDISIHSAWLQVSLPRHCTPIVDSAPHEAFIEEQWDDYLGNNLHLYNITDLNIILNSPVKLYLVSDGSLCEPRGGYASVFATDDSFLAHVHGATPDVGELNTSFRTEAYGMLSGLVMLHKLVKDNRCKVSVSRTIMVYSDSESLIKSICKYKRVNMTIKAYYGPDIDVIAQILALIKQLDLLNIYTVFEHVKGHQDGAPRTTPLLRPAILNIEADRLAGLHMDLVIPPYYDFPANQSTFRVHGIPVTSKYKFIIRNCYLTQELREYMVKKYEWSSHTIDQVWWKCHRKALDNLPTNDRVRIQKFIFNRWATNHRASMYSAHATSRCPACSAGDETAEHILQCPSPNRDKLRLQWLSELTEYVDSHHTPPSVSMIIVSGVKHWLQGEATPHLSRMERSASVHLKKAVREQHKLGWDHFIKGRLTREWASFINYELKARNVDTKYFTAETWGADIIAINWKFVLALWKTRNKDIHGTDPMEKITLVKDKLLAEVTWIQAQQMDIQGEDRSYILTPPESLQKMHASHLRAWLRNVKILIKASAPHIHNLI